MRHLFSLIMSTEIETSAVDSSIIRVNPNDIEVAIEGLEVENRESLTVKKVEDLRKDDSLHVDEITMGEINEDEVSAQNTTISNQTVLVVITLLFAAFVVAEIIGALVRRKLSSFLVICSTNCITCNSIGW